MPFLIEDLSPDQQQGLEDAEPVRQTSVAKKI